jgi:uroporphyrinogen decarboxylase
MKNLSPRERLRRTLNHQEPDRVPLDLGGLSTSIETVPFNDLKRYLGKSWETKNFIRDHVEPPEEMLQLLGIDTRYVRIQPPSGFKINIQPDNSYLDEWGTRWKKPPASLYWDPVGFPLAEASLDDLETYPWPDPDDPVRYAGLKEKARQLYENTDYAIIADVPVMGICDSALLFLRGAQQFFMDMVRDQIFVNRLFEILLELHLRFFKNYLNEIGKYIDVIMVAEDLGGQNGMLFSPEHYRTLVKPYNKKLWGFVKENTDAFLFLHCCGSMVPVIPDLIELGVDALNPVQVSARDMDPKILKERFGDQLTFWGGIDTQKTMPFGTPEDVEAEVKERIKILAPGGGFVLTAVHNLQPGVKPENIFQMYDSAKKFGQYPINF